MSRILLDPTTTDGGTATAGDPTMSALNPAQNAAPATPAAPAMPAPLTPHPDLATPPAKAGDPPRPAPIWVAPDDWTRQQGELQSLRSFKAEADRAAEAKEQERIRLMAEKGQIEEAFKLQQANFQKKLDEYAGRAKAIEADWLDQNKTAAINEALAGRVFTGAEPSETAAMVRRLLEGEVEAIRDEGGKPVIRHKTTLKPASEFLKERLDSPAFAVFFAATNRGGSGTDGARPAAATPKTGDSSYDAFAESFRANREAARQGKFIDQ